MHDPAQFANAAAAKLMHTAGEWDPPTGITPKRGMLHFSIGIPDSATLPREQLKNALDLVYASNDDAPFRYGLGAGYFPLREWLAQHYAKERHYPFDAEWFQITNGSSGAIDLVVRSLIDPGDVIIAEAPTYMGTLHNFRGVQADVRTVALDQDGLNMDALQAQLIDLKRNGKRVKLVYTISAFHNPSGVTLSLARRRRLLELAEEFGFFVLDDEAYRELWFTAAPPPPISDLSGGDNVITVGSFSKIIATGLRIGWIHATPAMLNLFRRMRFAMGQHQPAPRMLANYLLTGHLTHHLQKMRDLYQQKMTRTANALQHHASGYLEFERPQGGFYLWARIKAGLSAADIWRCAYHEGVSLNIGAGFHPERREPGPEHLRIAYAWIPLEHIDDAAQRLAIACERVAQGDLP